MTQAQRKKVHRIYSGVVGICALVAGACLIAGCVYLYKTDGFSRDAAVLSYVCVPVLVCLALALGGIVLNHLLPVETESTFTPVATPAPKATRRLHSVRILLAVSAAVLLILGIWGDGFTDLLTKAINICTECIGLG